jgi:hypothetical protein
MKLGGYFILFGIFLISFTCADSSIETNFSIWGCDFIFEEEYVGVAAEECSSGISDGHFYCGVALDHWITTNPGLGCSMGSTTYDTANNDPFCCPSGMFCNGTSPGPFICNRRLENCEDQENEPECLAIGCLWMDIESICTDSARNYDCGYYNTSVSCLNDEWNLGRNGIGTDLCGTTIECGGETFSIPEEDCECTWYEDAPIGDKCQLKMMAIQYFYTGTPNQFECSNIYSLGECIDGVQDVNWSSHSNVTNGTFSPPEVLEECLEILGCNSGESTRFCGEPIIKLPGFSLFSLLVSLIIIGIYFLGLGKFK